MNIYMKINIAISGTIIILTILNQVSSINYFGVTYVIGIMLLGKIEQLKYALSISGAGCFFDFFYLIFHCSDSQWVYIRFVQFFLRFLAFLLEVMWIVSVYCFMKQREEMQMTKEDVNRIDLAAADQLSTFPEPSRDSIAENVGASSTTVSPVTDAPVPETTTDAPSEFQQPSLGLPPSDVTPEVIETDIEESPAVVETDINASPAAEPTTADDTSER